MRFLILDKLLRHFVNKTGRSSLCSRTGLHKLQLIGLTPIN